MDAFLTAIGRIAIPLIHYTVFHPYGALTILVATVAAFVTLAVWAERSDRAAQ